MSGTVIPRIEPFERFPDGYDAWFDAHTWAFLSEVEAIRGFMPVRGDLLEVGVGTGRFAQALGIPLGVDPSPAMRTRAASRRVEAVEGTAEALPFESGRFDAVLMVTVVCFVSDLDASLAEAHRVLKDAGRLVIGFVDALSPLGRLYQARRKESRFYRDAVFRTVPEVSGALVRNGFWTPRIAQTLFGPLEAMRSMDRPLPGCGKGSFVVLAASRKPEA